MRENDISEIRDITSQLNQHLQIYQESSDRDEIFHIKKDILNKIRELEKKLNMLERTAQVA